MPRKRRSNVTVDDAPTSRGTLVLAVVVSLVIATFVPFGGVLLYPLTLLSTWVHEMGHGLTGLLVGGRFERLEIHANAAGLAFTWAPTRVGTGLVSLGGLVAPPVVGAVLFALARGARRAKLSLWILAGALALSLLLWVRSVTGVLVVPALAAAIGAVAWWGSPREVMFVTQFIGLRLALDTLTRGLDYVFSDVAHVGGAAHQSDIARAADALGGARLLWSLLVGGLTIALVAGGFFVAWRRRKT